MPNPYFQFKQFTVWQDQCAMKVCTDACIFGAWTARKAGDCARILDIGSGTGLLMLMLAQQAKAYIQGIEIEKFCYSQLKQNLNKSPWKERLQADHGDARNFPFPGSYDLILSNPPFFENDLKPQSPQAEKARHSTTLNFEDLLEIAKANLLPSGRFAVLLPYARLDDFHVRAKAAGLHLREQLHIRQSPTHAFFRGVLYYGRNPVGEVIKAEITIMNTEGRYTPEFEELLKDYYLYL